MTRKMNLAVYNAEVDNLNSELMTLSQPVHYWAHDSVTKCGQFNRIRSEDGVQLKPSKNKLFYRSLRGALLRINRFVTSCCRDCENFFNIVLSDTTIVTN